MTIHAKKCLPTCSFWVGISDVGVEQFQLPSREFDPPVWVVISAPASNNYAMLRRSVIRRSHSKPTPTCRHSEKALELRKKPIEVEFHRDSVVGVWVVIKATLGRDKKFTLGYFAPKKSMKHAWLNV
jgi:hypothetical protein